MKFLAPTMSLVMGVGLVVACSSSDAGVLAPPGEARQALLCGGSCDDGDDCTLDTCNILTDECNHVGICCSNDSQCDDGLLCSVGHCVLGGCVFNPLLGCESPDAGAGGNGGATPCGTNDDCHDGDRCTADICRPDGTCAHAGVPLCCDADTQCDDGLLCTVGKCLLGQCIFDPITGCDEGSGAGGASSGAGGSSGGASGSGSGGAGTGGTGGSGIESCATALDCGDGDPCTLDICVEPQLVCIHVDLGIHCAGGSGGASGSGGSANAGAGGGTSGGAPGVGGAANGGSSNGGLGGEAGSGGSAGGAADGGTQSGGAANGGAANGGAANGGAANGGAAGNGSGGDAGSGARPGQGGSGAATSGGTGNGVGGGFAGDGPGSGGSNGLEPNDVEVRGGACSCDVVGRPGTGGGAGLLALGALVWFRRRRAAKTSAAPARFSGLTKLLGLTLGVLMLVLTPKPAWAEGFNLDRNPSPTLPDDLLWTERAAPVGGEGVPFARLGLGFADDPLIAMGLPGGDVALVDEQYAVYASGGIALFNRLSVALAVPIYVQTGNAVRMGTTEVDYSGAGVGDPGLDARFTLLDRSAPLELGLGLTGRAPLGDEQKLMGEDGFSLWPRALIGRGFGKSYVGGQIGANLRPEEQLGDLEVTNELTLGAGAQIAILDWLAITGEVSTSTSLSSPLSEERTPVGFLVGLRAFDDDASVGGGVGPGTSPGYGSPDVRALAAAGTYFRKQRKRSVAGATDWDGDGIPNVSDDCPREPEDFDGFEDHDGCPDLDNDADRIPDAADNCPAEPEDKDGFEDNDGCPDRDNDQDGIADYRDRCPIEAEDKDGYQDKDGCSDPDNDQDGIADVKDECPLEPETLNGKDDEDGCPDLVRVAQGQIQTLEPIFFEYNSARIQKRSEPLLQEMAQVIKRRADLGQISIEGHTDSRGSDRYNKELSASRAQSVRKFLEDQGVSSDRLTSRGYGESRPIDDNGSVEGRARNRRVEFRFEPASSEVAQVGGVK